VKGAIMHRLDALRAAVDKARSVPMSASVMINRSEFLELLTELEIAIDGTLSHATEVVGDRDAVLAEGHSEAEEILRAAEMQRDDMLSDTDIFRLGKLRAEEVTARAEQEAAALRGETEAWVEAKLANFEDTLARTVASVRTGLAQLTGPDAPELDDEMRQETDEYVKEKLSGFEQSLVGTIELLHRGRSQLAEGHSHLLADDTDVSEIVLPDHLERS
jgi:cell division septum initiation protein DivIVA